MKKLTPKLNLRRETLIQLNELGQAAAGSRLIYTVYYPVYSDFCSRGCPILA